MLQIGYDLFYVEVLAGNDYAASVHAVLNARAARLFPRRSRLHACRRCVPETVVCFPLMYRYQLSLPHSAHVVADVSGQGTVSNFVFKAYDASKENVCHANRKGCQ